MCANAEIEVLLCENGLVRSGTASFACTGSAHLSNGQALRCTDASHKVTQPALTLGSNVTFGPPVTGNLVGQKWTCS